MSTTKETGQARSRSVLSLVFLSIVLGAVLISRYPALNLPLFWDELGVYGQSVFYLLEHGVSIEPRALDPELSRGHPMLYVFVNALFTSLCGATIFNLHLFNLSIALCLILATYALGKLWVNEWVGCVAAALLAAQPIFHAQATLILPEMSLALAAVGMLYAYHKSYYILYILSGFIAVWIKETAIFIPGALLLLELVRFPAYKAQGNLFTWFKKTLWIASPWLGFGIFLIIQRAQNGWFLFPYHTSLFDWSPTTILSKLGWYLSFLFYKQGRFLWLILLFVALYRYFRTSLQSTKISNYAPYLSTAFVYVILLLAFSSTNAFLNRYLLLLYPVLAIAVAHSIFYLFQGSNKELHSTKLQSWLVFSVLVITPWLIPVKHFVYDEHPRFDRHIELTNMAVRELMEQPIYHGRNIQCNFPLHNALLDDHAGFREDSLPFQIVGPSESVDFIAFIHPGSYDHMPSETRCRVSKIIEHMGMSCTIYECK